MLRMVDFVPVLRLFHVEHVAKPSHFIGRSSDDMHYLLVFLVGLDELMQSGLLAGWQRSYDKQLRRLEYQFLQQFTLELYFLFV